MEAAREKPDAPIHGNSLVKPPVRDNTDQAQSSCIDLRVQGGSDQSADDEEEKTVESKAIDETNYISPRTKTMDGIIFPRYKKIRSTKRSLRMPRTLFKNKAILNIMKFS